MRSDRWLLPLTIVLGHALGACSAPKSFIVLELRAAGTTSPLLGVRNVIVDVTQGSRMTSLTYPYLPGDAMPIDSTEDRTLSVSFSGDDSGTVNFTVRVVDAQGCNVGKSDTLVIPIVKGSVNRAEVLLTRNTDCPGYTGAGADGAATFPGCDPVNPASPGATANASAIACSSNQTCTVDCAPRTSSQPRNECVSGGTGAPGASCPNMNADCQPGTQCFDYTGIGCPVKLCLKFCNTDTDCAAFGAGGGGPGSVCQGPVECPVGDGGAPVVTAYRTCTFNCDPRAAAASARGGCPAGLVCVMPAAMDAVDCACPASPAATGTEGAACEAARDCLPGLLCNLMLGTRACRPICRCDAVNGQCTASGVNDCPTPGTHCQATTNNTRYGVCL